jgi:UDP-N-acetylglucosamine acyltransferase
MGTPKIHPTAIVHARAELANDVEVGPYAVVGPEVKIGAGTKLGAHVHVEGHTTIGLGNVVFPFAVLGAEPQLRKKPDQKEGAGSLLVGDRNVIREHVTIHGSSAGGQTRLGSRCLLMVGCHVAHDVVLGDDVTVANAVQLAGHVVVEDGVTFGGLAGVQQFARIGQGAFVAAGAMCERDVPPFVIVQGDRARVRALNKVGLARRGVPRESIRELERAFRAIFASKRPRREALRELEGARDPYVRVLVAALGEGAR